ncbi:MAG: hypothetical protein HYY04_05380 [Chloroflexi bacterium]|nr:hypothetical protein [Chloroflexota bacterium]
MLRQRVLALTNRSILIASVCRLLADEADLALGSVAVDDPEASAKIKCFAPDVVILDADAPTGGREFVAEVLSELPEVRVIALKLSRTDIDVYSSRRISEASLSGLLQAIQECKEKRR